MHSDSSSSPTVVQPEPTTKVAGVHTQLTATSTSSLPRQTVLQEEVLRGTLEPGSLLREELRSVSGSLQEVLREELLSVSGSLQEVLREELLSVSGSLWEVLREELCFVAGSLREVLREELRSVSGSLREVLREEVLSVSGSLREEVRSVSGSLREEVLSVSGSLREVLREELHSESIQTRLQQTLREGFQELLPKVVCEVGHDVMPEVSRVASYARRGVCLKVARQVGSTTLKEASCLCSLLCKINVWQLGVGIH